MQDRKWRVEKDEWGTVRIPADAHWGKETQRALNNFRISGIALPVPFYRTMALLKRLAAEANMNLGRLDRRRGRAVVRAAREVEAGKWDDQFRIDVFQSGSGTAVNMNFNEVIASRANEMLGSRRGGRDPVHPNDHVNLGQSSNDLFPTCIHVTAVRQIAETLLPALRHMQEGLRAKAREFAGVIKIGRTHLQDAVPVLLGQEFGGFAAMVGKGRRRIEHSLIALKELALGGTAVGTGLNTHPRFAGRVIRGLKRETGFRFREAADHFEAQGAREALGECSAALKATAVSLSKIANDIRWLASGPRCGIGEIVLPEVAAGSSIMPGKVNPVLAEALTQAMALVIGNDLVITLSGLGGSFELNAMMPLAAHVLLQSIHIMAHAVSQFDDKCLAGIRADRERCRQLLDRSLALATALTPRLGYDEAARIARQAYVSGASVREAALRQGVLSERELDALLDPWSMLQPK